MAMPVRSPGLPFSQERESVARSLDIDPGRLAFAVQKHSSEIRSVTSAGPAGECDSLLTNDSDIVLSIQVADCVPLFLYDTASGTSGLIHAGWRGTSVDIAGKTVNELVKQFGSRPGSVWAFMGPSIRSCCYEIGDDVAGLFSGQFLNRREGSRPFLDLPGANRHQLVRAGVPDGNIGEDDRCTSCDEERFESYRRKGRKAGRMHCFMNGR